MLSPEMLYEGWVYAHPYAHDETRSRLGDGRDVDDFVAWLQIDRPPHKCTDDAADTVNTVRLGLAGKLELWCLVHSAELEERGLSRREIVAVRVWEAGASLQDVACVLGVSTETMRTHWERGVKKLFAA